MDWSAKRWNELRLVADCCRRSPGRHIEATLWTASPSLILAARRRISSWQVDAFDRANVADGSCQGFYHYFKLLERGTAKSKQPVMDVGVVYLLGTIGETGEYDAASVSRSLRRRVVSLNGFPGRTWVATSWRRRRNRLCCAAH